MLCTCGIHDYNHIGVPTCCNNGEQMVPKLEEMSVLSGLTLPWHPSYNYGEKPIYPMPAALDKN